jgi:hypothetical protein
VECWAVPLVDRQPVVWHPTLAPRANWHDCTSRNDGLVLYCLAGSNHLKTPLVYLENFYRYL